MKNKENILEKIPRCPDFVKWSADTGGKVTLEIENKGFFNRLAQLVLHKPKISYVHLDELGSFVWHHMDGTKTIIEIASLVETEFGEKSHPLYERLAGYFGILESYGFVEYAD